MSASFAQAALSALRALFLRVTTGLGSFRQAYSRRADSLSAVEYTIRIDRGVDLPAADRNGKSDPYVTLTHMGRLCYTTVVPKTLDPVWNESFVFSGTMGEMVGSPLVIELFDEDEITADDLLGSVELDFHTFNPFMTEEAVNFALPFSSKGKLYLNLDARVVGRPTHVEVLKDFVVKPLTIFFHSLSDFVLYYRMPYDRAIWAKLKDPVTLLIM